MADTFFGFDTQLPDFEDEHFEGLDSSLPAGLNSEKEIDLLNEDTFGSGALDLDWEATHQKLAALHDDRIDYKKDFWPHKTKLDDKTVLNRTTDLDEEEEIIEQSLKSVIEDDDEGESLAVHRSQSTYKKIPVQPSPAWEMSPLSSPTSSNSLQELISPSSNIWSSPVRTHVDKENANKGSSNVQSSFISRQSKSEVKTVEDRPFSPAFEDDAIVKVMPKLHPPSDFTRKPPIPSNAIQLEELERELSNTSVEAPDNLRHHSIYAQTPASRGRPPPGIPLPITTPPPGLPLPPHQGYTMPPHMFQRRHFPGQPPIPSMTNPGRGLLGNRPTSFPQPPFHLVHSDPGHLRQRGVQMDRRGMPLPFPRFSSPQMQNRRYDNRFTQPPQRHRFDNRQASSPSHQSWERSERYHQHSVTDLDKKIHEILSNLDDERNDSDPYAGLMSRKEKEWVMKIQLLQLTSQNPDLDDFYYQTYMKRKLAKERAQRGEGVESFGVRRSRNNRGTAGQMELPHFQREERDYKPVEFQGSLGKVSASSVQHPRQMVDIGHVVKNIDQENNPSSSVKESRRRRQLMASIEKAYGLLVSLEDLERKILHSPDSERNILGENKQSIVDKIFASFKLKISEDLSAKVDDEFFVQIMSIRKGKVLLSRVLPFLTQRQAGAVLLSLTRNLNVVMKKDTQDEVLLRLIDPVTSSVEMASSGLTLQCTQNTVESAGSSLSSVLVSQFGASLLNTLLQKASSFLSNSQDQEIWSFLVSRLAAGFQDTPVKVVMKNLEAANKLVQLLSKHTNQFTTVTMQEHLRLASSTKQIKA